MERRRENPLVKFLSARIGRRPLCIGCEAEATHTTVVQCVPVCGMACASLLIGGKHPREEEAELTDLFADEVWLNIFRYLDADDMAAMSRTSRRSYALAREGEFVSKFRWKVMWESLPQLAKVPDQWFRWIRSVRVDVMATLYALRQFQLPIEDVVLEHTEWEQTYWFPRTMVRLEITDPLFDNRRLLTDLPPTLHELIIVSELFNSEIDGLPPQLRVLDLGECSAFNRSVSHLPSRLESLTLGSGFFRRVHHLPKTLTSLVILNSLAIPFPMTFPSQLRELYIGGGYEGDPAELPVTLEILVLGAPAPTEAPIVRRLDMRRWPAMRRISLHFPAQLEHVSRTGPLEYIYVEPGGTVNY